MSIGSHRQRRRRESVPAPHTCPALTRDARLLFRRTPVTELVRRAIRALLEQIRHLALEQGGSLRHGAQVAELTGMVGLDGYPDGTRTTVRHECPHPGAQLSLLDLNEGMCHEVFLTDALLSRRRCPRERLAEALNGMFKAELIEMQGPCCCAGKAIFFAECHIFRALSV